MTTFSDPTFSFKGYASGRPSYSNKLYEILLDFHKGAKNSCIDLGTGHGTAARALAPYFTSVTGVDPSEGMLAQARTLSPNSDFPNLKFAKGATEEFLPTLPSGGTDMIVSAQAAHWFDYDRVWPELARVIPKGGTYAVWGYAEAKFLRYPRATAIARRYMDEVLGRYWTQPGSRICSERYRPIVPPEADWEDVTRVEYEPDDSKGPGHGKGTLIVSMQLKVGDVEAFFRTWSAVHKWQIDNPTRKPRAEGGSGDIIDQLLDELTAAEDEWNDDQRIIDLEWPSGLVLARRR